MSKTCSFSAVVPVAGTGTRLRPHTYTYPKVLLTVGHKPILGHILDQLTDIGAGSVCLVVGHFGEKIREYVKTAYPSLNVTYVEQKEQKGLGHAIWLTAEHVKGPVFILLGDTIIAADMQQFIKFEEDAVGVREVADPRRFGVVETTENGYIKRITEKPEKPASNSVVVGAYSFKDSTLLYSALNDLVISQKTTRGEIQLTDAIQSLVSRGHNIRPVPIQGWYDCGKPSTLLATNRYILKKYGQQTANADCLVVPPVYIASTASVSNSIIGPYVSVGDGVFIKNSIISDSIINEKARIADMVLSDSLVGPGAALLGRKDHINVGESSEINLGRPGECLEE
ncbi:MAG: sugar phosphate nucleotidyltransferase [bacterium]